MRFVVTLCVVLLPATVRADFLYSQPAGPVLLGGALSAGAVTSYDNFTLPLDSTVTAVTWQGFYVPAGHTGGFTVTFWTDTQPPLQPTQPGVALLAQHVAGGETFLATDPGSGLPVFTYSAELVAPFTAAAGTYWISIVADTDRWFWSTAKDGSGDFHSAQDGFGMRTYFAVDRTFGLEGTAVPEPASLVLLASGLLAGLLWRLRIHQPAD